MRAPYSFLSREFHGKHILLFSRKFMVVLTITVQIFKLNNGLLTFASFFAFWSTSSLRSANTGHIVFLIELILKPTANLGFK